MKVSKRLLILSKNGHEKLILKNKKEKELCVNLNQQL